MPQLMSEARLHAAGLATTPLTGRYRDERPLTGRALLTRSGTEARSGVDERGRA